MTDRSIALQKITSFLNQASLVNKVNNEYFAIIPGEHGTFKLIAVVESTYPKDAPVSNLTYVECCAENFCGVFWSRLLAFTVGTSVPSLTIQMQVFSADYSKSRPSLEQVVAIVEFMEKHPTLALGQLRGLEGRDESKKLWFKLTRIVNNITGPTRPMKSWIKYWADKKSTVRSKVLSGGGDPNTLGSNIEKKIWDRFLANDAGKNRNSVKLESQYIEEICNDANMENHESEPVLNFEEPAVDFEERQMVIMEKLVKVMGEQAAAVAQLAHAAHVNAQAMERLADASQIQARAIERLASTFETISATTHDMRAAIVDIDTTVKRFYTTTT